MDYENMRIAEFLSVNWALFESFCESNGDVADDIYKAISDED